MASAPSPNIFRTPLFQLHTAESYLWLPGDEVVSRAELVDQCVALYNCHYGVWGKQGLRPGHHVRITPQRFADQLRPEGSWLAAAVLEDHVIGYCTVVRVDTPAGRVHWVTQLVVHKSYRKTRIATKLLYSVWQFSDAYAWGLATSNRFAVRALETATRRACKSSLIVKRGPILLGELRDYVSYLPGQLVVRDGKTLPVVDTRFAVSHNDAKKMERDAARAERRWGLGNLEETEEWLACTFQDQSVTDVASDRLEHLFESSDDTWMQAYERMTLGEEHRWNKHTALEVAYILGRVALPDSARILDLGCGEGRHAVELAKAGYQVTGVDVVPGMVKRAVEASASVTGNLRIEQCDAREQVPGGPYDLALLLYDVLGSSANCNDDLAILRNVRQRLTVGSAAVVSVMNATPLLEGDDGRCRTVSTSQDLVIELERLEPSTSMESSGSVFDPELIVHHEDVYYRKEQFIQAGYHLPCELVVRDRRFREGQIAGLLKETGFEVLEMLPVQAGQWARTPVLEATDTRAKELLIFAQAV